MKEGLVHRVQLDRDRRLTVRVERKHMVAVVLLVVMVLMVLLHITHAQDLADPGQSELFPEAMLAYRLGHYYFVSGRYEQAVDEYAKMFEEIPCGVFETPLDYAMMYWDMGDAQFMTGQYDDALMSYQHYLDLAGEQASARAVAFVKQLEDGIAQQRVNLTPLSG